MSDPIQVYGQFAGHFSHAVVSRGIVGALHRAEIPMQLASVEGADGPIDGVYEAIPRAHWPDAPVGLFIGGYPLQGEPMLRRHGKKLALLVAEGERIPDSWRQATRDWVLFCPSRSVARLYRPSGVGSIDLPHGVDLDVFCPPSQPRLPGHPLALLHVCGAASFPARKGTPELLEAFEMVFGPRGPRHGQARLVVRAMAAAELKIGRGVELHEASAAMPPAAMAEYLRSFDAVVQPSRAEGFGLVPFEAAACGVPAICTHAGSQRQVAAIEIPLGASAPMATNGVPANTAPMVSARDIALALIAFAEAPATATLRSMSLAYHMYNWDGASHGMIKYLRENVP